VLFFGRGGFTVVMPVANNSFIQLLLQGWNLLTDFEKYAAFSDLCIVFIQHLTDTVCL